DVDAIDGGRELRKRVQLRFHLAPVVAATPVPNQLLQLGPLRTLRLIGDGFLVGPSRGGDASTKVDELRFRNVDAEGADPAVFGSRRRSCGSRNDLGVASNSEKHKTERIH